MTLIDAMFINYGGGKVLLEYLVAELENQKLDVFYLFDERCKGDFNIVPDERCIFIKSSLIERHRFYAKHRDSFDKIFCLANLAPTMKLSKPVYTYFHQTMYLKIPSSMGLKSKFKFFLKRLVFKYLSKNSTLFLVQSDLMGARLTKEAGIEAERVKTLPFFPTLSRSKLEVREKRTYIYVSDVSPHKNHKLLIEAFSSFAKLNPDVKLVLTVAKEYEEIYELIEERIKSGVPIVNVGFVDRNQLSKLYTTAEYLIYPSSTESFGLGVIEAIEMGCKVIGVDLPYMHEICKPSILFDLNEESICNALESSLANDVVDTQSLISNNIEQLIIYLK